MKKMSVLLVGLWMVLCCGAEPINVGSTQIEIPCPEGYVRVTDDMEGMVQVVRQFEDEQNELLAYFIMEEGKSLALEGNIPSLAKTFMLKTNKQLKDYYVKAYEFVDFHSQIKAQAEADVVTFQDKLNEEMRHLGDELKEQHKMDVEFSISKVVPMPVHFENATTVAYSILADMGTEVEGEYQTNVVACTMTFVYVTGKILMLGAYAPAEELEWTRDASKKWVTEIVELNQP
jgi:hypothetical protein